MPKHKFTIHLKKQLIWLLYYRTTMYINRKARSIQHKLVRSNFKNYQLSLNVFLKTQRVQIPYFTDFKIVSIRYF